MKYKSKKECLNCRAGAEKVYPNASRQPEGSSMDEVLYRMKAAQETGRQGHGHRIDDWNKDLNRLKDRLNSLGVAGGVRGLR